MPHKHTRRPAQRSVADFDLAPTARAAPLPTRSPKATAAPSHTSSAAPPPARPSKKRKRRGADDDDTPAEFKRLMRKSAALSTTRPTPPVQTRAPTRTPSRPRSTNSTAAQPPRRTPASDPAAPPPTAPKLSALSDPALSDRGPLPSTLAAALKNKSTRLQKKIERKVAAWRTEDERLRDKRREDTAAAREANEARLAALLEKSGVRPGLLDEDAELAAMLGVEQDGVDDREDVAKVPGGNRRERRRKRKAGDGDDWAVLEEKRGKPRFNDVAQAPPELRKVRKVFKDREGGRDVAGGLKGQADLTEARTEVIRRYRAMMGRKEDGGL